MSGLQILTGDCREVLPTLEAGSVQCCVTSPPYWGLRDYGTAQWEGGEEGCDHFAPAIGGTGRETLVGTTAQGNGTRFQQYRNLCPKCGARRIDSQLGLEATPEEYIANMVAVFREVGRVLRDDGTLWLNMGDSYASGQTGFSASGGSYESERKQWTESPARQRRDIPLGLKPKDLCMMPARVAMALQTDGWYIRSDIIWHKPNPMPESVTDRPTKAHEYIFFLTKAERYFYDAEAIREKSSEDTKPQNRSMDSKMAEYGNGVKNNNDFMRTEWYKPEFRNKRTVWTIATQPYAEAHFATFPEELPKLCILAGSKPGDTILDPFAGSGTVGQVALELGRKAILIELNPAYIELAQDRTLVTPGFF